LPSILRKVIDKYDKNKSFGFCFNENYPNG
jgi:hypothetical protein